MTSGKRRTEQDYHDLAVEHNHKWIDTLPAKITDQTLWLCPKGHERKASYRSLLTGRRCKECYGKTPRTERDFHDLAIKRGFEWVGKRLPKGTDNKKPGNKTSWRCTEGHEWKAVYNNILNGTGCPYCAGHASKIKRDYHNLVVGRGLKWIGKELPKNVTTKTLWLCSKDHKWKAPYHSIRKGIGCPQCHIFKGPDLIAKTLQPIGIDFETEKRFSACRNKYPLPFDFFLPALNLLIEYQGEHHFKSIWGPLSNVKRNDKIKKDWAQENGYELLYINYWDYDRIAEILADRLKDYAAIEYYKQKKLF